MNRVIAKDATDQSVTIVILTESGTPKTDVVHNTASLALWYRRAGGAKVAITPAALATPTVDDPHLDGGFIHISDGVYRLDLPDAAVASGADHVTIGGSVPDGVILVTTVQLVTIDLQAANVPANLTQWKGSAPADLTDTDKVQVSVQHTASALTFDLTGSITGNLSGSVGSVTGNVGGTVVGSVGSISGVTFPGNFGALGINASGHIERVTLVDTTTTNTDMRGTDGANTATPLDAAGIRTAIGLASANLDTQLGTIDGNVDAILTDTGTTLDGKLDVIDGVVDAIKVVTDKLDTTVESDGATGYQFTETALENAPAGGGDGGLTTEQATQLSETHDRVTTALPDAAPSSEAGLPVTGDLITSDDLMTQDDMASPEEVAAAVDSSLQVSLADVISYSEAGLTMIQDGGGGSYQFTSDAVSEIDVGEIEVDLTELESMLSDIEGAIANGINVSIVQTLSAESELRANGTISLAQNEARSWTINHPGLDLTGATLRFVAHRRVNDKKAVGIFELEGASVTGGDDATTIKFSSTETANALGEHHYWELWQNPDDSSSATMHGRGPFRVTVSCNDVS